MDEVLDLYLEVSNYKALQEDYFFLGIVDLLKIFELLHCQEILLLVKEVQDQLFKVR